MLSTVESTEDCDVVFVPDGMIFVRAALKKSGGRTPRVELVEIGPSIDFSMRRSHLASDGLMKEALKQPKELKVEAEQEALSANSNLLSYCMCCFRRKKRRMWNTTPLVQRLVEFTCRDRI